MRCLGIEFVTIPGLKTLTTGVVEEEGTLKTYGRRTCT